jgi:hypothetical protein
LLFLLFSILLFILILLLSDKPRAGGRGRSGIPQWHSLSLCSSGKSKMRMKRRIEKRRKSKRKSRTQSPGSVF